MLCLVQIGCQKDSSSQFQNVLTPDEQDIADHIQNDPSMRPFDISVCRKATTPQILQVNRGNEKKDRFIEKCVHETGSSYWCDQLVHPNWESFSAFTCTYGPDQIHQLVHPDESLWKNPIAAVKIIQDLSAKGIKACEIYNWWRPEPYNKNVGGASGRHPYGTSVDVRFCDNSEANRAFKELCRMRKQGRLRAIGHYGTDSLHLGIADKVANTWGRSCP